MGEGRSRSMWAHTSALLAMEANLHRDPKKSRSFKPDDFNPHMRKKHSGLTKKEAFKMLKQAFVRDRGKKHQRGKEK